MTASVETSIVLDWLGSPRADRELQFAEDDGGWRAYSYDEIAARAHAAGAQLAEAGLQPNQVAIVVLPTGPDFVAAFYGVLAIGATPCPIAPPTFFSEPGEYRRHLARAIRLTGAPLVVTDAELRPIIEDAIAHAGGAARPLLASFGVDRGRADTMPTPRLGLMQFTSGSTGSAHCGRVTWDNLETHTRMQAAWQRYDGSQIGACWLPLYHDMGLIGCLLMSVAHQGSAYWLRPDQFVRTPVRWLECFGRYGASITAAPTFAFAYASKRVGLAEVQGMDFSGWDVAVMGAERVDARSLHLFAERFAAQGFEESTFTPAYGLAEATLAVTGTELDAIPTAARVDWRTMRSGAELDVEVGLLGTAATSGQPAEWLVGCGRPLGEIQVTIVGDDGVELPEGHLGEIVVEGPTVVDGYEGETERDTPFRGQRLHTADAGFLHDGQLYALGRMGDMLTVRGRNVYAEDLEARLSGVSGMPKGRFVLFSAGDELVCLVEGEAGDWVEPATQVLLRHVGEQYALTAIAAPRGTIERTSSRKPRRRAMSAKYTSGQIHGTILVATRGHRTAVAKGEPAS